jgi:hypothetical protein
VHFLRAGNRVKTNEIKPMAVSANRRDLVLSAIAAICLLGAIGHFLDWRSNHLITDRNIGLGFTAAFVVLVLVCPDRLKLIFYTLVVVVAWGVLGAIATWSLDGLPLITPCFLLACLLLWWKKDSLF